VLDVWQNYFESEVDNLGRNCEIDDLFLQPIGIDLEVDFRCGHLLLILCKRSHSWLEYVQMRDNDLRKWHIDESCKEDRKIGSDEIENEDLLHHCRFMRCQS
jgi:hypothetical protein